MQIDIGYGDALAVAPVTMEYPVLVEELGCPIIRGYAIETIIAEKFEAIIDLGILNSRMKDFYDIYSLLKNESVDMVQLEDSIRATFKNRGTRCVPNHAVFSGGFATEAKQAQWQAFVKRSAIPHPPSLDEAIATMATHLLPIYKQLEGL